MATFGNRNGALDWCQEEPNRLIWSPLGEPPRLIGRGTAAMNVSGQRVSRIPPGHPEGYLEAFATIYTEVAAAIMARRTDSSIDPAVTFPTIEDGFAALRPPKLSGSSTHYMTEMTRQKTPVEKAHSERNFR